MTVIEAIAGLFAGPGARDYLGEPVAIGVHMRQAGALAEAAGAAAPLVAAALLHDIGHLHSEPRGGPRGIRGDGSPPRGFRGDGSPPRGFRGDGSPRSRGGLGGSSPRPAGSSPRPAGSSPRADTDSRHAEAGARWLSQWFGEAVTEPVRLHVAAKRYLCAVEPGYFGLLSPESVRTLSLQGGPMTAAEVAAFGALPHARDAVAVRRWDEAAKDPAITPPEFSHFVPLLGALVRSTPGTPTCGTAR